MKARSSRSLARRLAVVFAAGAALGGCRTDGALVAKVAPPPPPKEAGIRPFGPARYLEEGARWIERAPDGTDRAILNTKRVEVKGAKVLRTAPGDVEVEGGAPLPGWLQGPAKYLFWKGRDIYLATSFLGDLVKIAALQVDVSGSPFPWLDGIGLPTETGTVLLVPGKAADLQDTRIAGLPVPGGVEGLAADGKRAVALNVFGRALLTVDGGKTFRDLGEEMGDVRDYDVRGDDLVISAGAGRDRFVGPDGKVSDTAVSPGPLRGARPPDLEDAWADLSSDGARYFLTRNAIPLGGGVVLVVTGDRIAKVELETSRVISTTLIEDMDDVDCTPVKLSDTVLLACRGSDRATVIDVTGVPKIERTFEVADTIDGSDLDGFSAADGVGLGYLGPCSGPPPVRDEVDAISGASSRNQSSQRSPVFCARAASDNWVEHRLDADDATDVIGWAPRPGGDAVALIARSDRVIPDEQRVTTRGGLRVVRFPRMEPPLALSPYSSRSYTGATREMRAAADGSVEAWVNSNNYGNSTLAAVIDAQGHVHTRPIPPRVDALVTEGPFALAHSDDGRLYETVDWGKRWIEVPAPPGNPQNTRPSSCTAVGCAVAGFARIGWDSVDAKLPSAVVDYETGRANARSIREKYEYRRPPTRPPIVKLACSYASPAEGARLPDSYGFGFTTQSLGYRGQGLQRLGSIGAFSIPWWQGPMPSGMDLDLAWVDPFDLDGRVHRLTVPLSRSGVTLQDRPHEQRLGYVVDEEGRVDLVATGSKERCLAPVLEEAGIVAKVGGCLDEPSAGVRIKDRIIAGSGRWNTFALTAIDLPSSDGSAAIGSAVRELRTVRVPASLRGFTVGIGARAGQPVGVAVDGRGDAVLAPIDPNDGYIGEAERLAPLSALAVGTDGKCPTDKLAPHEARVVLPFETAIGLARGALPGVTSLGTAGAAVIRWSKDAACLEAVEMTVRDDRYDPEGSTYEPPGQLRKLVARFAKAPPRRGAADRKPKAAAAKKPTPAASASASASAAASASPTSPFAPPPPTATASSSASAAPSVAPIPVSPPLPKGAGEGTLLLIQYGFEVRQKLFCTGTSP